MATATAAMPSIGTIGSTMVVFYPVPTPWSISAGCDERIHRQPNNGAILAYDPVYARLMSEARRPTQEWAESCYPVQHQSWWFQAATATPSTVLGPTFVCPQSFTAVHSTVVGSDATARTEYTYCCPPKFTLNIVFPQNQRGNAQCTSILPVGSTLAFLTFLTTTLPAPNSQTIAAWTRTTTLVVSTDATVSGGGVNGYNIIPQRQLDSAQSTGAGADTTNPVSTGSVGTSNKGNDGGDASRTSQPSESSIGTGAIVGVVVGACVVVALLVWASTLLFMRRRRKNSLEQRRAPPANDPTTTVNGWLEDMTVDTQSQGRWR
ncbi:hypothetical protein QBC39DRAFT_182822 [Podospora conica]|nr:hypothetical protein QBC39DRAFT_182822 [Schizothecium conicum]